MPDATNEWQQERSDSWIEYLTPDDRKTLADLLNWAYPEKRRKGRTTEEILRTAPEIVVEEMKRQIALERACSDDKQ